jgi:DNA primase
MTLSPQFLDELRARTSLSALIGKSVKLTKAGREYKACCPFHHEKTPSFYVNDEKGFYHCFGCQAHGDAIRFLTDARGLPFMDAVKELADAAGLDMPAPDPQARARAERATSLYDATQAAQAFFEEQLGGLEGGEARAYLQKRGISDETRRRFGFGFAPDSRGKLRAALKQFGNDKLIEAGLLVPTEDGREPYDRFRGRLTFPIRDRRGRVIAFSARILGQGEPKYLNSPETPIFDKGRTLFNIDRAAAAARAAGRVIVVEGQMDVIALDQAGISEAVAPLGTALTDMQLALLWQMAPSPILCFDGDAAGQKAARRAVQRALPSLTPERSLRLAPLPDGKDPDDLVSRGGSPAFVAVLNRAESLTDFLWRTELHAADVSQPEGRAALKKILVEAAATIGDKDLAQQVRSALLDKFWETFGWRRSTRDDVGAAIQAAMKHPVNRERAVSRALLLGLTRYPEVMRECFEDASQISLADEDHRSWLRAISYAVLDEPDLDENLLSQILETSEAPPDLTRDITKDLAFSFFYRREPDRGRSDLRSLIAVLATEQALEREFEAANSRLAEKLGEEEFHRQIQLKQELADTREHKREVLEDMWGEAAQAQEYLASLVA